MTTRSIFRMLALATALAGAGFAHAEDDEARDPVVASTFSTGSARGLGVPVFPLEEVLNRLRVSGQFAFIFDSRLIAGKTIGAVDRAKSPERALESELEAINLRLHKMGPGTYAITEARQNLADDPADAIERSSPQESIVDTILVMGTTQIDGAAAGSKRIFQIDSDDLAFLSVTSPAEAIYDLPQSLASLTPANTALFGATAGISLADLRGLDPKRTLILVNGRRRTLMTGGNGDVGGVDLNSIAEPFLERIEVQSLPGGARYGGSAVAGTINFVTKSNLDGLETGARFGMSERGDAEEISLHLLAGRTFEGLGNFSFGVNAVRIEGLVGADREFTATPYSFGKNGFRSSPGVGDFLPGFGGSSTTDRGAASGVILSNGEFAPFANGRNYVPALSGAVSPYVGALDQLYNWLEHQAIILPNDRILGFAAYNGDLGGGWTAFAEVQAGASATDNRLAPLPATRLRGIDQAAGDAAVIPLDNPTLPQSIRDIVLAEFGAAATGVVFDHRYAELGPRRDEIDRRYLDVTAGVEKSGEGGTVFSVAYRFADNQVTDRSHDRIDRNRLQIALDQAACAAVSGCSPVDFFSTPEISSAALEFITIPEIRRETSINEHELTASLVRPAPIGGGLEGEFAAGIELRRAVLNDRAGIPDGLAPIGVLRGADNRAVLKSLEAYAQFDAPLVDADSFPGEIDASLAVRFAKSSQFDLSMNFEAGVDWRPSAGLSFFMRRHIGERTPDLIELFAIAGGEETGYVDPCSVGVSSNPIVAENCASIGPLGVNPGFVQTASIASTAFYGNPDLDPERIRSAAYGLSLSPTDMFEVIPGRLQMSATWLDFEIGNAISASEDQLFDCYSSPNFSDPSCGANPRTGAPLIARDPVTRQIDYADETLSNSGGLRWRGLDLELRYALELDRPGFIDRVWTSALHTYTDKVERTNGSGDRNDLTGLVDYPRHRTLLSAGVETGPWSIVAFANRRGRAVTARIDRPEAQIPAAFYVDLTARLNVTEQAYVQVGVENVTDEEPAITAFNEIPNFAPEYYDPVGRRYSFSVRLNF